MIELLFSLLNSTFGFLLLIGILVTFHEFGHFIVAKKLGIKVVTFSIGFGKTLWSRKGKDGVLYRVALIPLGGYVAMLDERLGNVLEEELPYTFNAQPFWKRFCVIAAGPFFNILLAFILLWGLFIYGVPATKPYLGTPPEDTIFFEAGFQNYDLVTRVNGREVLTIDDFSLRVIDALNGSGEAEVTVLRQKESETLQIHLEEPLYLTRSENILQILGLHLYQPDLSHLTFPATVGTVLPQSIAERIGVKKGDIITALAGQSIHSWDELESKMETVRQTEINHFKVEVKRHEARISLTVSLTPKEIAARSDLRLGVGFTGIAFADLPEVIQEEYRSMRVVSRYGFLQSLHKAGEKTLDDALLIFRFIGRMVTGRVNINNMAGPIAIADIAGETLRQGLTFFIELLALFSINLGVINLLPIPVLDGGRLVGLLVEKTIGKDRISAGISNIIMQMGAIFLFLLMGFVILNDVWQFMM